MKTAERVDPNPATLVESLRDFGYTLPSALADLIDNSLTAGAREIRVTIEASGADSHIAVVDDGAGMATETLVEAMRLGTKGPLVGRSELDLGRFGLGLKTASLSQGRCLTVTSKTRGDAHASTRRWDLRHIKESNKWELLQDATPIAERYADRIEASESGTAVVIEELDRPTFLQVEERGAMEHLATALDAVRQHLSMVFHRFIADGVSISLGPSRLKAWDPFLRLDSKELPSETLNVRGRQIVVTPFVLPHHSRITDDAHQTASGPHGWNAHQGFYIYRCRRLIVPGTWLNLHLRKEEHFKLARILVDLPNGMDSEWQLNVMKSHVAAPAVLRDDFKRIARDVRREAAAVYRYRGEKQTPAIGAPERHVWRREATKWGVRYRVDRGHPVMRSLLHIGCEHEPLLAKLFDLIESTIPIASMLQEPAKAIDGSADTQFADVDGMLPLFLAAERYLIGTGKSPQDAREIVLLAEPFAVRREAILSRLASPPDLTPSEAEGT